MTNERLQEIFDSCAEDVPDMHLIYGRAVWQAARDECLKECLHSTYLTEAVAKIRALPPTATEQS